MQELQINPRKNDRAKSMTPFAASGKELLSAVEAADYLGVSPHTLAIWRHTKRYPLPYVLVGVRVKYRRADLEAFVVERTVS